MLESRSLLLTKRALAAIVLGLVVVGRRNDFWPLTNWGMYSRKPIKYPAPTATAVRVRLVDSTGQSRLVAAHEIWGIERSPIALRSFVGAFNAETHDGRVAHRMYLVHLLDTAFPRARVQQVQGVRMTWSVEPAAVPPLLLTSPQSEEVLGMFNADSYRPRVRGRS
jgi:hypothetical protein